MEIYQFEGSSTLPSVYLDSRDMLFEVKGCCFPEDSIVFFQPLMEWLRDFEKKSAPELKVVFSFTYCNTSSSKVIQNFFEIFERIHKNGTRVTVEWYYDPEDEDIYEAGISYSERVSYPVDLLAIEK